MPARKPARPRPIPMAGPPAAAGYSGTPLARKLTLKPRMAVWAPGMPASVKAEIDGAGLDLRWLTKPTPGLAAGHLFVTRSDELARHLVRLRKILAPDGQVWISWPKKAAGVATDVTEDAIRKVALPQGWVDIKVCAVDSTWSALKLVIRKALR